MAGFRSHIAVSLDGYIADSDGSIAWMKPYRPLDPGLDGFLSHIGTLVMGRTTYDQLHAMGHWPQDKRCIVVTSREMLTAPDNVEPWMGDLARLVERLKAESEGDVWVAGGAKAIRAFMDLGAIGHLDLMVAPVLLGRGKPLFEPSDRQARLTLLAAKSFPNGVVRLSYVVNPGSGGLS